MKKQFLLCALSGAFAFASCSKSDSENVRPSNQTVQATGTVTNGQTGLVTPINPTVSVSDLARKIQVHCSGPGYTIDGWIDDSGEHGDLTFTCGGNMGHIKWLNANPIPQPPTALATYQGAVDDIQGFNYQFPEYYDVTVMDGNGNPTTMEALRVDYSTVVLPAWQTALADGQ